MNKVAIIPMLLVITSLLAFAQKEYTVEEYIDTYKHIAIKEMEASGIPASITLAQGILESRFGNSTLAVNGNNHFGIKCHTEWTGKKMYHDDDSKGECFRVYKHAEESYDDHTVFLQTRSRYSFLFDYSSTDYKNWAHGLKTAGYATNPRYAYILIDLIERHQLFLYDSEDRNTFANKKHNERDRSNVSVNGQTDYKSADNKVYSKDQIDNNSAVQVFSYNRIKTIKVGKMDDIKSISQRTDIPVNRLYKYNDLDAKDPLVQGQFIYLQPKRSKAGHKSHIVTNGQTLWDISQLYGVKLDKLYDRNLLRIGEEPAAGQTIYLNSKRDKKPLIVSAYNKPPKEEVKENPPVIKVIDDAEKKRLEEEAAKAKQKEKQDNLDKVAKDAEHAMEKAEADAKRKEAEAESARLAAEVAKLKEELRLKEEAEKKAAEQKASELPVAVPRKSADEIESDRIAKEKSRVLHKVVKGDTLYGLSKKYNVTIDEIKKWNNLSSTALSIGQELEIFRGN
ncbi:MAG: LysM peptidoglycan-binding domain-containing protein [Chitinophagales bacterium]